MVGAPAALGPPPGLQTEEEATWRLPVAGELDPGPRAERAAVHGVGKGLIEWKRKRDTNVGARSDH